jgi:hypothetical protein
MMEEYKINYFPPGLFSDIQLSYEKHDKTCSSIPHLWLGHTGGKSCFGEQAECDNCQVVFYYEGLKEVELPEDFKYYCDCCYRALAKFVYEGLKDK